MEITGIDYLKKNISLRTTVTKLKENKIAIDGTALVRYDRITKSEDWYYYHSYRDNILIEIKEWIHNYVLFHLNVFIWKATLNMIPKILNIYSQSLQLSKLIISKISIYLMRISFCSAKGLLSFWLLMNLLLFSSSHTL